MVGHQGNESPGCPAERNGARSLREIAFRFTRLKYQGMPVCRAFYTRLKIDDEIYKDFQNVPCAMEIVIIFL